MHTPPRFPIPVVRALIEDAAGRVLLLQRANTAYGQAQWCLPGGKLDHGQTMREALAREILEETSLQLLEAELFFVQDSLPAEPDGMHCLNLYFRCTVEGVIQLNEESSAMVWVDAAALSAYPIAFRNDEALMLHFHHRTVSLEGVVS